MWIQVHIPYPVAFAESLNQDQTVAIIILISVLVRNLLSVKRGCNASAKSFDLCQPVCAGVETFCFF